MNWKSNRYKSLVVVIILTLIGGFLRFYKNTENPPSLNGDEISFGYSAYSVLKTGRDEYGKFLPVTFQSVGDYKNPVPAYLMVPSIAVFGLTDFAVRFPNAAFATLMIPLYFLFLKNILKDQKIALISTFILTFSAWHISYARYAYETLIAGVFVLAGVWSFIKMLEKGGKWIFISSFFFVLAMYTAFAARLFVPIFVALLLLYYFSHFKKNPSKLVFFLLLCTALSIPLGLASLFGGAGTRLSMVLIYNDIEFIRYINLHPLQSVLDLPGLLFFWLKRYLNYLQPDFLFFNGLGMTAPGTLGLGPLYFFDLPLFVVGILELIRRKIPYKAILIIWLLSGIIPDSLTNNQQHAGRLLQIAPVVFLILALGLLKLIEWWKMLPNAFWRISTAGVYGLFIILVLAHTFLVFVVHFPKEKSESFDEGLKPAALYINEHKDQYDQVVVDPRRGVTANDLISNPFLYVLFYSKYDPQTYQNEPKLFGTADQPNFRFNKYSFRYINWSQDRFAQRTLFIGSPFDIPEKDLKPGELLGKIYLSSGDVAFLIVSLK